MEQHIEIALDRAVAFLQRSQLPHGEFKTLLGSDMQMSNAVFDSSPFVTTFVVYALTQLERRQTDNMLRQALLFLEREMEFGGVWRYFSSLQFKHCRIPPDLDDTACATYALRIGDRKVPNNEWIFHNNKDAQGRFLTWVRCRRGLAVTSRFRFARVVGTLQAELARRAAPRPSTVTDPRFLSTRKDIIPTDDVDPVVNANVLLLLGQRSETAAALRYLIDFVRAGPGKTFSLYYLDVLALYYMVARAYRHSAPALAVLGDTVAAEIARRQHPDGSFGASLSTAMAASALLSFFPDAPSLPKAVAFILQAQRHDGSWEMHPFYSGGAQFWGSEELTTAFCMEVLARYRLRIADGGEERDEL